MSPQTFILIVFASFGIVNCLYLEENPNLFEENVRFKRQVNSNEICSENQKERVQLKLEACFDKANIPLVEALQSGIGYKVSSFF